MTCNNCFIHPKSSECQEFCDTRRIVVTKDNRSTQWIFKNPSEKCVCKIKIDRCVIEEQTVKKCDYLLLVCDKDEKTAFFIELKGADSKQAIAQILSTVQQIESNLRDFCLYARVALTKGKPPSVSSSDERKLKDLLQEHNKFKAKKCERKIIDSQATHPTETI